MKLELFLPRDWHAILEDEFHKQYWLELNKFIEKEYQSEVVYPKQHLLFHSLTACPLADVKVVIIGQDPYHGPGQANGLAFSVNSGVTFPPSLRNIFKEINSEIGEPSYNDGDLSRWAHQGVLLLNAILTVRDGSPGSHQLKGWETFTDAIISKLNEEKEALVFMLWGSYAQKKGAVINSTRHLVLTSAHPSPLSSYRGFFGNKHFITCNEYLSTFKKEPINWL